MAKGKPKAKALKPKELVFAECYLSGLSAREAALRAGYAESTADRKAHLWVAKSREKSEKGHLWDYIDAKKSVIVRKHDDFRETLVRENQILGFSDIGEIVEWGPEGAVAKPSCTLSREQTAAIRSVTQTRDGVNITMHGKSDALERLCRIFGVLEPEQAKTQIFNLTINMGDEDE